MSIISSIKELIYNFSNQITDNNASEIDITDDNFMRIAMADGMSQEDIMELQRSRNGISMPKAKKKIAERDIQVEEPHTNQEKSRHQDDEDRSR